MADILFVCVHKDLAQVDALADLFQAAGFSIGDLPDGEAELRAAGAALLVWSTAANQSALFHEAAARALAAERAVFATLDGAPRPANLGETPFFDLSGWGGNPDDNQLDPLFAAIDRMTVERRAESERWGRPADRRDDASSAVPDGRHGAVVHEAQAGAFAFADGAALRAAPVQPDHGVSEGPQRPRGGAHEAARAAKGPTANRRRVAADARRGRPGRMLIPLLASASIAAAAYFGGLAESRNAPATPRAVRVAIPPPASANLVGLSAPAVDAAAPEFAPQLQPSPPPAPPEVASHERPAPAASVEPPRARPLLRVRTPSARLKTLSATLSAPLDMPALTPTPVFELEPIVFSRRGRTTRLRSVSLDHDDAASAPLLERARVETAALVND